MFNVFNLSALALTGFVSPSFGMFSPSKFNGTNGSSYSNGTNGIKQVDVKKSFEMGQQALTNAENAYQMSDFNTMKLNLNSAAKCFIEGYESLKQEFEKIIRHYSPNSWVLSENASNPYPIDRERPGIIGSCLCLTSFKCGMIGEVPSSYFAQSAGYSGYKTIGIGMYDEDNNCACDDYKSLKKTYAKLLGKKFKAESFLTRYIINPYASDLRQIEKLHAEIAKALHLVLEKKLKTMLGCSKLESCGDYLQKQFCVPVSRVLELMSYFNPESWTQSDIQTYLDTYKRYAGIDGGRCDQGSFSQPNFKKIEDVVHTKLLELANQVQDEAAKKFLTTLFINWYPRNGTFQDGNNLPYYQINIRVIGAQLMEVLKANELFFKKLDANVYSAKPMVKLAVEAYQDFLCRLDKIEAQKNIDAKQKLQQESQSSGWNYNPNEYKEWAQAMGIMDHAGRRKW